MVELTHNFKISMKTKKPYDFQLTVHKPAGWNLFSSGEIYENGTLWTALYIGDELTGVKLYSSGDKHAPIITAEVFTKSSSNSAFKRLAKDDLTSKLSVDEDLGGFYALAKEDKILSYTIKDLYGMHNTDDASLFSIALLTITLQMAPLKRSQEMLEAIVKNYGETAEFDDRRIMLTPSPKIIAKLNPRTLKSRCNLGYRAKFIVQLAKVIEKGFPSLEELRKFSAAEAKKKLLGLPGIGDYSADIINPGGGFPIDVWSADVFGKLFYGEEPENGRDAIERIKAEGLRRWGEWSWYAFFYVVNDLENLSKKLGTTLRLQ
ncbi:hypothetical protein IHE51_00560 [Candidatus Parvarchaeota archaeon]|uniref:DNA-(apurinic or apyrimidinic site) lyase n=1 Tax=Candidatus Acidifodinimicrobium mancum TaxID=2898728 RepID=A0A8T3UUS3_9ARCH|nr:hypothetical protein [Candidatus Acidifodinimicrobium mancum]MBE5728895.1 hypothetical protein [Candidatus Acidifodinimicrobium mancum]MBE5729732.1 hypothetical protein [Candidatus Acidifodinimicrobium mancum]